MAKHEQLLKDLIGIKSYSGEETILKNFIADWFEHRQIANFAQDDNLIVRLGGEDRTRAFIFNSHMDTVSSGILPWRYGPWTAHKDGDKMIWLGASDMKGGLAASMLLAEAMAANGKPPVDMWFTYVVKEEVDGSGTESVADWFEREGHVKRYSDMAAISTEPTGLKELEHGHRGNLFLKMTTEGGSGHASRPHLLKTHSVRQMMKFADALQTKFGEWSQEFSDGQFTPPTLGEITSIQAGVAIKGAGEGQGIEVESPNKFPAVCTATFDIRTTPQFHRVAFEMIKEFGRAMNVSVDYAFPAAPAGYTDPTEKKIKVTKQIVPSAELTVSDGSADLGFLTIHGIKAVIFGPGEKDQSHKTNEYCYPSQIPEAVEIYKQIVEVWAK